jgi:hypothetical protein
VLLLDVFRKRCAANLPPLCFKMLGRNVKDGSYEGLSITH